MLVLIHASHDKAVLAEKAKRGHLDAQGIRGLLEYNPVGGYRIPLLKRMVGGQCGKDVGEFGRRIQENAP
jgi:hypothetical protein